MHVVPKKRNILHFHQQVCQELPLNVLNIIHISLKNSLTPQSSLVPRPRKEKEEGPGTYCTRMHQIPQENLHGVMLLGFTQPRTQAAGKGKRRGKGALCLFPRPGYEI
jgi:hypothetical protein